MGTASFSKKWVAYDTGAAGVFHPVLFIGCAGHFYPTLTANVLAVDRQRCLDAGCDAFLGKPVRVRELLTVCSQLFNQSDVSVSQ